MKDIHIQQLNNLRQEKGFMTIDEIMALVDNGNIIFDPLSVLISVSAVIGKGNTLYPCISLQVTEGSTLQIGDNNIFYSNTFFLADKGSLLVEDGNQFGDGGCTIKANVPQAKIEVGSHGRYVNGCQVYGKTTLGSGSQIIGPIVAQNVDLAAGEAHSSVDYNEKAAVLKGHGLARDISVGKGEVINGQGSFVQSDIEKQVTYHE